jgi:DNA-binding response OmpR family regulator
LDLAELTDGPRVASGLSAGREERVGPHCSAGGATVPRRPVDELGQYVGGVGHLGRHQPTNLEQLVHGQRVRSGCSDVGDTGAAYARAVPPSLDEPASLDTFSDGNLHIDFGERLVIYDVRPASLRNRFELNSWEAAVLAVLIEHRRETLAGEQLCELAWGHTDAASVKRTVKVIARFQMRLSQMDLPRCPVETAPPIGYRYRVLNS